jgi:putative LysE/RhtB family amino acid efflux pump
MIASLLAGLTAGFLVAAQVGPIWLLCARSVLRYGAIVGLGIGAGAAIVDTAYAALGAAGAARLLTIDTLRVAFGLIGATVLVFLGTRTIWSAFRVRAGGEADDEVASPANAFRTSLAATASNPMTIASWASLFAAASVAAVARSGGETAVFLAGIGTGSFAWFAVLSGVVGVAGRRAGPRTVATMDVVSGAGIAGFGLLLGWRTLRRA